MARWRAARTRAAAIGAEFVRMQVKDLTKRFQHTIVLDRINLEIREKEFLGLLGPSGSGKTTLLRILAGLEFPDSGAVLINDRDALSLDLEERQIGFVFQHYALFNHMSAFENVAFGLKVRPRRRRPARDAIRSTRWIWPRATRS